MAGRQLLVWHPSVHAQFGDELVFYLMRVNAFPKDAVYAELEAFLVDSGHTSYRIYRVFGTFDIILRVWVQKGDAAVLGRKFAQKLEYVVEATPVVVEEIPHHWKYKDTAPTESLARVTRETVRDLQDRFSQPDTWNEEPVRTALEHHLVRVVNEVDGAIMFFTGVTQTESRALDANALLGEIYALFEFFPELDKTAVYRTRGRFDFLIKCETAEFFTVGELIEDLSHKIAVNRCGTVTSVVATPLIRGSEEIGKRSFQQVEKRDIPTLNVLPEVYDDDGLTPLERANIESWIRDELTPKRDTITNRELDEIKKCLRAVLYSDETEFLSTFMKLFGPVERELRSLQGRFIGNQMGPDNVRSTLLEALKHKPNADSKRLDLLTLGDRLDVYAYVIKENQLSADPDVVEAWNEEAHLRRAIAS